MVKDLIKLIDVPQYIFQKTGVMITKYGLRFFVNSGDLPLVSPQTGVDKRFAWTLKRYVDQVIERYSK